MIFIYGLCDPRTSRLRYVGQTSQPLIARLCNHLRQSVTPSRFRPGIGDWIKELKEVGSSPEIFEIEVYNDPSKADEAERFWIAYMRFVGCDLVNRAIGGSVSRGWHYTPEQSAKMSAMRRGRPNLGNKGMKRTPEQRARIAAGIREVWTRLPHPQKGRIKSDAERQRISEGRQRTLKPVSKETRERLRTTSLNMWADPEFRQSRIKQKHPRTPISKGVRQLPSGRFEARARRYKTYHYLGSFDTSEAASSALSEFSATHPIAARVQR